MVAGPSLDTLLELARAERAVPNDHGNCEGDNCGACTGEVLLPLLRAAIEERDRLRAEVTAKVEIERAACAAIGRRIADNLGWPEGASAGATADEIEERGGRPG